MKLPKREQDRAFASMKKAGILKANRDIRRQSKSAPLIRERSQGQAQTVMCSGCSGFYDAKNIYRHKNVCPRQVSQQPNSRNVTQLSESAASLNIDAKCKNNILNRFRNDRVGDICRTDLLTILLGKKLWAKSVKKEKNVIMAEMRLMANLIASFRKETDDENASGIDLLSFRKFDVLEEIIEQLIEKEDGHEKAGLKLRIGFLLKKKLLKQ
ncbi:histone-lysine N-methyltransferase setd8-a [Plakobranchus ocellatus]|uniref:Histone-lysine N-methyltransferase setd8-a n=1 Tax=Plakobranchus ocellatus TaxID=259542 RepID=A0AAV3ZK26_9GAST|nr:histone-lysine N-methyltransferase setd8-a [Plakobranchus ocellatus]